MSGAAESGAGAAPASAPASAWGALFRSALPLAAALPLLFAAQALVPEGSYALKILYDIGVAIILAVSLNVVNGFTGQFSIGHAGFMAVGAYAAAYLTLAHRAWAAAHGHAIGAGEAQAVFLGALLFGALLSAGAGSSSASRP